VTAIGIGAADFWNALLEKKCGVKRIAAFDPTPFDAQLGAEIVPTDGPA
jgi:3-oxoacyl-[acyl-carrier-protein] synthase II